jgi:hypothetical protein
MVADNQTSQRTCSGCGKSLEGRRSQTESCSAACRMKAHRRDNPHVPAGPPLRDLINAYREKLQKKTPRASESFAKIAQALAEGREPLAGRRILTITAIEWERWLARATEGMADSTKGFWRRYLHAMLKGTPHFLADPAPRAPRSPVDRAASHAALLAGGARPQRERPRLVVELVALGFYPREIQTLSLDEAGQAQGPAAWDRHSRPEIPPEFQERLRAFALAKGIPPGKPILGISRSAITEVVRRTIQKASQPASAQGLAEKEGLTGSR